METGKLVSISKTTNNKHILFTLVELGMLLLPFANFALPLCCMSIVNIIQAFKKIVLHLLYVLSAEPRPAKQILNNFFYYFAHLFSVQTIISMKHYPVTLLLCAVVGVSFACFGGDDLSIQGDEAEEAPKEPVGGSMGCEGYLVVVFCLSQRDNFFLFFLHNLYFITR